MKIDREDIINALKSRPMPQWETNLQDYSPCTSKPSSFTLEINTLTHAVSPLTPQYPSLNHSIQTTLTQLPTIRSVYATQCTQATTAERRLRARVDRWMRELQLTEEFSKGLFWTIQDNEPVCLSDTEAVEAEERIVIPARYITDPQRFETGKTPASALSDYSFHHCFQKVPDPLQEHLNFKLNSVWSLSEIRLFLEEYFKHPNQFTEIQKRLPEKSLQDITQFYYLVKYEFRLKRCLRTQARKKKEGLPELHTSKILRQLQEKSHNEWISISDIASTMDHRKYELIEDYFTEFGKDMTKLHYTYEDYQDYCYYKQWAFGAEKLQDEGPSNALENSRPGNSQWSYDEKMQFLSHFQEVGRDWNYISSKITSKTPNQVRNFYQNYKKKLNLEFLDSKQDPSDVLNAAGYSN